MIQLKQMRDSLLRNKRKNEEQLAQQDSIIRNHLKNNQKERARFAIQRSQLYQQYQPQLENKYLFVQKAILEVEKQQMDADLAPVMQQTNKMLKEFNEANRIEETLLDYQDNRQEME